jgi:acyl-CoA synthetase (AMP-forming)/AMP-acid ligase II
MIRTIGELLNRAQILYGERPFLSVAGDRCTFSQFVLRVRSAANWLRSFGVGHGDRVVTLLPRDVDEAVFLLAAMLAGGVAVPVHSKLKDDQVAHILEDAEPAVVVSKQERTVGFVDASTVLHGYQVLDPDDCPTSGGEGLAVDVGPHDKAVVLYTSGSTGRAKGIVHPHQNLLMGARVVADYLELTPTDHTLVLLSFSFDYGLNQLLCALLVGCPITAADHLGVAELARLLKLHQPSGLAGVPSLWHEVADGLRSGVLTAEHGSSLRYITNSGGALRAEDSTMVRSLWPHVNIFAMYGLTEAFRSAFLPPAEFDQHPDSFGYAIAGVELVLVSVADGQVLSGPATGELVHVGALVASGYWRRPKEDAARFRPDPRDPKSKSLAVYTGDLVRRDEAGRHFFVARRDRMLKVQGHRVSPDEVARAVLGMEGVGEVYVLGVDSPADGHRIILCLAGAAAKEGLREAVLRRCRARLPSYMVPAVVLVLHHLPHNANGKVDDSKLRVMLEECTEGT